MRCVLWKTGLSLLVLSACQSPAAQSEQPAILLQPDLVVRQELQAAVLKLSGFSSVLLAETDLTKNSELLLERKHQFDAQGQLIQGRDLEVPQRFSLLIKEGACWLVHQNSGQRSELKLAKCRAQ